jgi:hypothetical protein
MDMSDQITMTKPTAPETQDEPAAALAQVEFDDEAYEKRIRDEKKTQFKKLKDNARVIFGQVNGHPGVRTPDQWAEVMEKAGDDIGNASFIVRQLGAERYLDYETVAVLISLRQNLLSDIPKPRTADIMAVDAAVIAYYNMLRAQAWIGDLALLVERKLFGEKSLFDAHGEETARRIEKTFQRIEQVLLPLQDRAHRMMMRSLASLGQRGYCWGGFPMKQISL